MSVVILLVALAVVGVLAAVVTGRLDPSLPPATSSSPHLPLPGGPLHPDDVDALRFSLAVRGYRMDEVDSVLDRLRAELVSLQTQLAERGSVADPTTATRPATGAGATAVGLDHLSADGAPRPVESAPTTSIGSSERRHGRRSRSGLRER